jgi:hypothetical protein
MIVASRDTPIRFCVGPAEGVTSHSWRIWTEKKSELYMACRDSFKDIKISLHASGRWRMGFTEEAIRGNPRLIEGGRNRAWDVWDKPAPLLPGLVVAFSFYFPQSEFLVLPSQRLSKLWRGVRYIHPAPRGRVNVITVCVGAQGIPFDTRNTHLGRFVLANNTWAHVMAHDTVETDVVDKMRQIRERIVGQAEKHGQPVPADSFGYFLATALDGRRSLLGLKGTTSDLIDAAT